MEEIKRLLPNYEIRDLGDDSIFVNYKNKYLYLSITKVLHDIDKWKYIHDNYVYLEGFIFANGYELRSGSFVKKDKYFPQIKIWFNGVEIVKNFYGDQIYYDNPDTIFSNLREYFGVELLNKPVNKHLCD